MPEIHSLFEVFVEYRLSGIIYRIIGLMKNIQNHWIDLIFWVFRIHHMPLLTTTSNQLCCHWYAFTPTNLLSGLSKSILDSDYCRLCTAVRASSPSSATFSDNPVGNLQFQPPTTPTPSLNYSQSSRVCSRDEKKGIQAEFTSRIWAGPPEQTIDVRTGSRMLALSGHVPRGSGGEYLANYYIQWCVIIMMHPQSQLSHWPFPLTFW